MSPGGSEQEINATTQYQVPKRSDFGGEKRNRFSLSSDKILVCSGLERLLSYSRLKSCVAVDNHNKQLLKSAFVY